MLLNVFKSWVLIVVLLYSVVGVWTIVIFILSVMRVIGGNILWVICVSVVNLVAILSAVVWVICSFFKCLYLMLVVILWGNVLEYRSGFGFICGGYCFILFSPCC